MSNYADQLNDIISTTSNVDTFSSTVANQAIQDEHEIATITDKMVEIGNIGTVVKGESNSQIITFSINRYYDGVDLSDKKITCLYQTPLSFHVKVEYATDIEILEDNTIKFKWILSGGVTQRAGLVIAAIQFIGTDKNGDVYSLKTTPFKIIVQESLDGTDQDITVSDNWFTKIESRVSNLENNGVDSGVTDYQLLQNLPSINGVTISGSKTLDELGVAAKDHTHSKYTTATAVQDLIDENKQIALSKEDLENDNVVLFIDEEDEDEAFDIDEAVATSVNAYLPEYFGEETKVKELGLATLKNVFSHINVTFLGVDNTGTKDNADLLQTIVDSVPNGSTLYFPYGEYSLSHGITIDKSLQLLGDRKGRYLGRSDSTKIHGSCLKFMDTVSNDTMITQGANCWSLTIHDMMFSGNSGAFYDDGLNDEAIPYAQYRYDVTNENVNGVLCIHSADITDCSFCSFSGYGLSAAQAQNVNQCKFYGNGIGVYAEKNDVMLRDCYITAGRTGIYCVGSKNLMVYDCYIDLLSEYGIYCESWLSGFINAYIDHTNYSGIHANTFNNLMVIANMHRNGMYNSGLTVDDLLVSDDATAELENFSKACAVSCKWIRATTLQLGANIKNNDDSQLSSKSSPVIAVYAEQAWNSLVIGTEIDVKIRGFNELNALTLIGEKGTVKYSNNLVKTTPNVVVKSYPPSATTKTCNIGDMWYNSYKKEWYVATAITDTSTTWERQYTTTEIADIISRLETLENASATTE